MLQLELKNKFPELKFICPVLDRMILNGNKLTVNVSKRRNSYVLCITVHRCKSYSFVQIQRDLANFSDEAAETLAKISCNDSPVVLDSDYDGQYICLLNESEKSSSFNTDIPELSIPVLDSEVSNLSVNLHFPLRKQFNELDDLVKTFNLLMIRGCYGRMSIKSGNHLELHFTDGCDHHPSLSIACGLKNITSRAYCEFDANQYGLQASKFNRLLMRRESVFQKFYFSQSKQDSALNYCGPSLEFRAI